MSRYREIDEAELRVESLLNSIDMFKEPGKGTTRLPLSKEEHAAREYLIEYMKEIGLEIQVDAIGNIYGCLPGQQRNLAPVWTGSHIDTVKEGGKFDGIAGVVCGMEALRLVNEKQLEHKRDLVVVIYISEESARFGMGCIGSRTIAGHLKEDELKSVMDESGKNLAELLLENNIPSDNFDMIQKRKGDVYASVELHIEQASNLERHKKQVGIVTAICAPTNLMLTIEGEQSHAGGTSMEERKDAFMAAAEISLMLEECAKGGISDYTTGTVGYVEVTPNAVNVIPGKVKVSIDVRDSDYNSKNQVVETFLDRVKEIAEKRHVKVSVEEKCNDIPMKCDSNLVSMIEEICVNRHLDYMKTVSGAYHDSLFIGEFAPVGMIFVPSKNGISHSPEEWTDIEDLEVGTRVLTEVLLDLANEI